MGNTPFYLFMDQLRVHTSTTTKDECAKHCIYPIYNVTASPDFNPIETVFASVKKKYSRARLNALANGKLFNQEREVRKAFECVTPELV